ncbi:MAG: galactosyldiacylglycerol synthase [Clostridia bacterium]|nr:galactosyldiacylglycerol synthase [Clostridia bacterium]
MKIIILSASTGGGHMSAANCVKDYFNNNGDQAEVIDTLEYINHVLNKTVTEIYEYVAIKHPALWKMIYKTANNKKLNKIIFGTNNLISKKLLPLIETQKPDLIISTHPFATEMVSSLKSENKISVPLLCIMTDYAPHRTWISPNVNAYIVANEEMVPLMEDMDVPKEKIHPFGIPVDNDFFIQKNREEELEKIGLNSNLPTILIMAGSCGFANVEKMYTKLQKILPDFQIIIITGKNKRLFENLKHLISTGKRRRKRDIFLSKIHLKHLHSKHFKLSKKFKQKKINITKPTKLIYYTHEVDKYMQMSDLIITKPGGLTISEALACNLPMALFEAIPGQEEENAEFLVSKNMAVKLISGENEEKIISNLIQNPQQLNFLKHNCENFDKSNCLKNIYDLSHKIIS